MTASKTFLNFIGGDFKASATARTLPKIDPSTGETIGVLADSDLMDVVFAIQAGNKAFATWSKSTLAERKLVLESIATLIEANANAFANAIARDIGTPISQTLKFSIPQAANFFRTHAELLNCVRPPTPTDPTPLHVRAPIGLVGIITPASDPLVCLSSRLAPALAGGNAVIVKVSQHTAECGVLISQIISQTTLPSGAFACLQGRGETLGEAIIQHPGISTVAFLGSTETGRRISLLGSENLKRLHLSLGAKNPVLVFADADLQRVIPQVTTLCLGLQPSRSLHGARLFIQESIFKDALTLLKKEFDAVKVGSPFDASTQLGPLPTAKSARIFREAVALAKKENGKMVTTADGDQVLPGHFVQPILFADLTNCSTLQQDEILGPLVLATSFKYQHDALKHTNVSPYGRLAYIFEPDLEKAKRVAMKLEVGRVFLNVSEPTLEPFSPISLLKNSGSNDEGARALARFFRRDVIVV